MQSPELIKTIMKKGGYILVVGGGCSDLPLPYHEHPQILIWDDNQQNLDNKEIPTNTRVIMYNRWISHTLAKRLSNAARNLHALRFPMLKARQMKELLSEVVQAEPQEVPEEVIQEQIEQVNATIPDETQEIKELDMPKQTVSKVKGFIKEFVAKNIRINLDYDVKGTKSAEGTRLYELATKEGIKTTKASVIQAVYVTLKELAGKKTVRKSPAAKAKTDGKGDDFAELNRLIEDAITAMKLVQEHLPNVLKETEKLRAMRAKFLALLE